MKSSCKEKIGVENTGKAVFMIVAKAKVSFDKLGTKRVVHRCLVSSLWFCFLWLARVRVWQTNKRTNK